MDDDVKTAWHFVALHDLHPGDEHPDRKGWFLQYERGPRGEPMWLKPTPWRAKIKWAALGLLAWFVATVLVVSWMLELRGL